MADFEFRFPEEWYTAQGAKSMYKEHMREMREEYSRMRSAAQKRIKRLKESEFSDSKTYKENAGGFKELKDIDPRDFHKAFKEVSGFLKSKRGSASGQREIRRKTIESLNKAMGAKKVNTKNYKRVIQVLEELRRQKKVYDSETIADRVQSTMALSDTQFDELMNYLPQFIESGDMIMDSVSGYMLSMGVSSLQQVEMGEFLTQIGW